MKGMETRRATDEIWVPTMATTLPWSRARRGARRDANAVRKFIAPKYGAITETSRWKRR